MNKPRSYDTYRVNKARKFIYELGKPIKGVHVERLLKDFSGVPTLVSLAYTFTLICDD